MNSILVFSLLVSLLVTGTFAQLVVETANGRLRGRDQGAYYSYESIPYAEPPLGELRLEPPQPFNRKWDGILDATKPSENCAQWSQFIAQPDKLTGNEDCLTVNVYKPKNESRHTFPVIANIFGGAFSFGGTMEDEPQPLMSSGNVILVKINHRVGPLGFLSTGDAELPGNMGLKDQRMALRWIKKNIGYFGGESDNILFLGFSSGAASVHLQLMNKDLEKLVKVAVSLSANALDPWVVQGNGRRHAFELGRIVGCGLLNNSSELKKCLKSKDAMAIAAAASKFLVFDYMPFVAFGPVVEPKDSADPFMTQHPTDIIKSGKFAQIPWLVTYTPEDGIYNAALVLKRQSNGKEAINELNNRWFELAPHFFSYRYQTKTVEELDNHSRELRHHYLGNKSFSMDTYFEFQRMVTDVMLKNATEKSLDLHRRYGKSPLYSYVYDNPADRSFTQTLSGRQDIFLGTGHGDDYFMIMSSPIRGHLRADEKVISWKLIKMLEQFAETGTLAYDNCKFRDNVGQNQYQLVIIQRIGCHLRQVDELPATVSNNLPIGPVVLY
ncbi:esterase-5B-like [Drosophila innubila]|uniref:esterase-5B-like n=1 Tax=Drosophila innubila TaxID=198719 RepID=UPI00148BC10E|nr:esterase-5B-like [Drosophila innubila]